MKCKHVGRYILVAMFSLAVVGKVAGASSLAEQGVRTWTSTSGAEIDATFVKEAFGRVDLRKADGTTIRIPLARLSADDKKLIKDDAATDKAGGARKLTGLRSGGGSSSRLTAQQIESLVTEWKDPAGKKSYRFVYSVGVDSSRVKKVKAPRVPFRITCSLYEIKGKTRKRMSGTAKMTIDNEKGTQVLRSHHRSTKCALLEAAEAATSVK